LKVAAEPSERQVEAVRDMTTPKPPVAAAAPPDDDDPDDDIEADLDEDPENYRTAFMLRVDQAIRFAAYSGPITKETIDAARGVAEAWTKLAQSMEGQKCAAKRMPVKRKRQNLKNPGAASGISRATYYARKKAASAAKAGKPKLEWKQGKELLDGHFDYEAAAPIGYYAISPEYGLSMKFCSYGVFHHATPVHKDRREIGSYEKLADAKAAAQRDHDKQKPVAATKATAESSHTANASL
jgi:hypothetical protein